MLSKFTKAGSSIAVIIPSSDLKRLGIISKDFRNYTFDMRLDEDTKKVILSDFKKDITADDILNDLGFNG